MSGIHRYYVSFGQAHVHTFYGITFDKDSLCMLEIAGVSELPLEDEQKRLKLVAQDAATRIFGQRWSMIYEESQLAGVLAFYPRGVVNKAMRKH